MKFLLDTNVLSEFTNSQPSDAVVAWLVSQPEDSFHISVLSLAEIRKGIERLPQSRKKSTLQAWSDDDLPKRFAGRIINFDLESAWFWGRMTAKLEGKGRALPVMDSLLAAQALQHHCHIATRNEADFMGTGIQIINPWKK